MLAEEETQTKEQTLKIAELNDRLRIKGDAVLGTIIMTDGVADLQVSSPAEYLEAVNKLTTFNDFAESMDDEEGLENDPYMEHDFGTIVTSEGTRLFFKVDYYRREKEMMFRSEAPWCVKLTYRVLTFMLASEY